MHDDAPHDEPKKLMPAACGSRSDTAARTTSEALLGAARELIIEHHGREYRLRLTQQGKLILTA
jgi:hemin uptake protein HemP